MVPYDDAIAAVKALKNGQIDCVVIDNAPAQELVKANPGLTTLETEYANEKYAIGVAQGQHRPAGRGQRRPERAHGGRHDPEHY